jgi:hypothetical protein
MRVIEKRGMSRKRVDWMSEENIANVHSFTVDYLYAEDY